MSIQHLYTYRAVCDRCGFTSDPWQDHRPIKQDMFGGESTELPDGWGRTVEDSTEIQLCSGCEVMSREGSLLARVKAGPTKRHSKPYDSHTVNIETAAKILGISKWMAYEQARKDNLPVPVIRIGRRMVVSKQALEELLDRQH